MVQCETLGMIRCQHHEFLIFCVVLPSPPYHLGLQLPTPTTCQIRRANLQRKKAQQRRNAVEHFYFPLCNPVWLWTFPLRKLKIGHIAGRRVCLSSVLRPNLELSRFAKTPHIILQVYQHAGVLGELSFCQPILEFHLGRRHPGNLASNHG